MATVQEVTIMYPYRLFIPVPEVRWHHTGVTFRTKTRNLASKRSAIFKTSPPCLACPSSYVSPWLPSVLFRPVCSHSPSENVHELGRTECRVRPEGSVHTHVLWVKSRDVTATMAFTWEDSTGMITWNSQVGDKYVQAVVTVTCEHNDKWRGIFLRSHVIESQVYR